MKAVIKKVIALILLLLILSGCCSCNDAGIQAQGDTTAADGTDETEPEKYIDKALTGKTAYTIIRSEDADEATVACASELWKSIYGMTGELMISVNDDSVRDETGSTPEIILGMTNRTASSEAASALPAYMDYSVTVSDSKITIYANDAERLMSAVDYFKSKLTFTDGVLRYTGDSLYIGKYDGYKYKNITLCGSDISSYVIIIPQNADSAEKDFAHELAVSFARDCGCMPEIKNDSTAVSSHEIIIGKTNRDASRDITDGSVTLGQADYRIRSADGVLALAAATTGGYNAIMEKIKELLDTGSGAIAVGIDELSADQGGSIDGCRVMFVGNSFTYYGDCVKKGGALGSTDQGYFYQLAKSFGDTVKVINYTKGDAYFNKKGSAVHDKSLYNFMVTDHPDYYDNKNGKAMDPFYEQDYVILQQGGGDQSTTYVDAKQVMSLFPPTTKFLFYVTTYAVIKNHTNVLSAGKSLRDRDGVTYIPLGQLEYNVWTGKEKLTGSALTYNKNTFIVDWTDSHHPNFLTGYFTSLMTYCAITGRSAVGADYSFVSRDNKTYYTKGTSNFPSVLESAADMKALQELIDKYISEYNP